MPVLERLPALEDMTWNELARIELSTLVDVGVGAALNMSCQDVMQRPAQMVGEYVHQRYPDLLPV